MSFLDILDISYDSPPPSAESNESDTLPLKSPLPSLLDTFFPSDESEEDDILPLPPTSLPASPSNPNILIEIETPPKISILDKLAVSISPYKHITDTHFLNLLSDFRYNNKNYHALYNIAKILSNKKSKYYNLPIGTKIMQFLVSLNYPKATCFIARYSTPFSLKQLLLFKKAAYNNNPYAQTWLGSHYNKIGKITLSIHWFQLAISQKYIRAMNELANIHYKNRNYTESFALYLQSHECGNIIGSKNVGLMYLHGYGVKKDKIEAKKYLDIYAKISKDGIIKIE